MTDTGNTREVVLELLLEIIEKKSYSHLVLRQALNKYQYLEKQQRAFITRLTEGTVEQLIQIDYILNQYSKVKVSKMKPVVRNILRMGVYQICFMDGVPDSAACNEAVKLAKRRRFEGLSGFINGVLRAVSRNKEELVLPGREEGILPYLSVKYSIPEWLIRFWLEDYEEGILEEILRGFRERRKTTVRCNLSLASKEEIMESLKAQKIQVTPVPYSESVLEIENYDYLETVDAFSKGWIQVQDISSCLAVECIPVSPGAYVIDVCSAPGGKALHIADRLNNTGYVEARDLTWQKVSMIEENRTRSGFTNIGAKVQDALEPDETSVEKADILIADLPCSGLGIMGKKPDIRYNITKEQMDSLVTLQRDILSVVWRYVKPGGILLYSTCTINKEENQKNTEWFLEHFPFEPVSIEGRFGEGLHEESMKKGMLQLLPGIHQGDGFFIALMKRLETT